jgi:hypothetical protein
MDLLLNEDNDLDIVDGDFVVGDETQQQINSILEAQQGHFKQSPLLGVGIRQMLNGGLKGELKRNIQLQLESDGIAISSIKLKDGELKIDIK